MKITELKAGRYYIRTDDDFLYILRVDKIVNSTLYIRELVALINDKLVYNRRTYTAWGIDTGAVYEQVMLHNEEYAGLLLRVLASRLNKST